MSLDDLGHMIPLDEMESGHFAFYPGVLYPKRKQIDVGGHLARPAPITEL